MMGNFEKFNETLYISRGEKFVASLELKLDDRFYDICGWHLTVRERDCVHDKNLGIFLQKEDQPDFIQYELRSASISSVAKGIIGASFEGKLWNSLQDIISRSQDLLRALEYN